jgi:hypothetical protein
MGRAGLVGNQRSATDAGDAWFRDGGHNGNGIA